MKGKNIFLETTESGDVQTKESPVGGMFKRRPEKKIARYSKKFKQLTYFYKEDQVRSVECSTKEKANWIISISGIDQHLVIE